MVVNKENFDPVFMVKAAQFFWDLGSQEQLGPLELVEVIRRISQGEDPANVIPQRVLPFGP
ncbi:hypothetical protein HBO07_27260 [Pseudomonas proteolytica]|nr:hypothetical protein [Pseudomonas proteolytica]